MSVFTTYSQFSNGSYEQFMGIPEPSLEHAIRGPISSSFREYTIPTTEAYRETKKPEYEISEIFDKDEKFQLTEKFKLIEAPKITREELMYSRILTEFQRPIFPFHPALPYHILNDARTFILAQKKSIKIFQSINKTIEQVNEFLNKKGFRTEITVDLFTDQEYVDWKEPRINVKVINADLSQIFRFRTEIYNIAFEKVPPKIAKNIILHIEGFSKRK